MIQSIIEISACVFTLSFGIYLFAINKIRKIQLSQVQRFSMDKVNLSKEKEIITYRYKETIDINVSDEVVEALIDFDNKLNSKR